MDTKDMARLLGSNGGKATLRLHGKDHYSTIGKQGASKRWNSKRLLVEDDEPYIGVGSCKKCKLAKWDHNQYSSHEYTQDL